MISFFRGYGSKHKRSLEPDKIATDNTDAHEVTISSIFVI